MMKIEYWIGLADILLRIPDIHVGPLNTMSDIVMKNEYWIGWIIFGTFFQNNVRHCFRRRLTQCQKSTYSITMFQL